MTSDTHADLAFLAGDGEMARLMRAHDWAATSLGVPQDWPQSLRTAVRILLNTRHPIYIFWGDDGACLYNDAYRQSIGPERHPVSLGRPAHEVWEEIWPIIGPQIEQVKAGRGATWNENALVPITRNGVLEDVYWTYSYGPIDDEVAPNGVGGVLVICTETTQTVLAEQKLARELERFVQLFEQSPNFVCVLRGPEHRFEYTNPGYLTLVARAVVGKTVAEALPETIDQGFGDILDTVYRTGEAFVASGIKYLRPRPDGGHDERYLDFVYQPISEADGTVSGIFVEGTDLTERTVAELAVRESRRQLEMITDAIPQQVWTARPDGQLDYINGHTKDYVGDVEIIDGIVQWTTIVHPDDLGRTMPVWRHSLTTGEAFEAEQRIFHKASESFRWNLSRALPIRNDAGEIVRWFGTNTDIEDRRLAADSMAEARNAAEAANIAKSEFLANMSHEIRTPMNAVIGLSALLAKSAPLSPRQAEFISTLQMSADSLLALINDLLDIAKIEARTVELEHIPFSLTRIVQEVASMMAVTVKTKGLTFTGTGDCIDDRVFLGDPTRLRQIITNLCSNAVKFTSEGEIGVSVTCHDTDTPGITNVCIAVSDTGVGIAPDKLGAIFHKFVQADASINRKYGGTGLGLAITSTLTEIMGGTISVDSEPGKGSTFTVCIPLAEANVMVEPALPGLSEAVEAAISTVGGIRVLLVEDYEPNIMVAVSFLEDFGYTVDVATNGAAAVEKVRTIDYAVVMMDVQMHGMNGLDATRRIREWEEREGRPRLPIIGMTAHALAGDRERCLAVGMDDYVAKPFKPDELRNKIRRLIEG